jgi:elongation factor P
MISTNDMRPGQAIIFEGRICLITQYDRVKPGKGPTFVRAMLKDITTGQALDKTWRGEQKVELAILEKRPHQYLYRQGDKFHFMDMENYEQIELGPEQVPPEIARFLKENMEVVVMSHNEKPLSIEIPAFVSLKVVETAPGLRGDTVSGASKPATLESGFVIQVPLFINQGDVLKVDTRTGTYVTRA